MAKISVALAMMGTSMVRLGQRGVVAGGPLRPRVAAWKGGGDRNNKLFRHAVAARFPSEGFCQTGL